MELIEFCYYDLCVFFEHIREKRGFSSKIEQNKTFMTKIKQFVIIGLHASYC